MKSISIILISTAAFALAACGSEKTTADSAPTATEAATEAVTAETEVIVGETSGTPEGISYPTDAALLIAGGEFEGRSEHITTGRVNIVRKSNGYYAELADNFSLDGAPDPVLGFGKDGEYVPASKFSVLENITGAQSYKLGDDFDPAAYDTVFVWCEKFSVPLGAATLSEG